MFRSIFDDDPIFSMHQQHMQRMQRMMADPFGMMEDPFRRSNQSMLAIDNGQQQQQRQQQQQQRQQQNRRDEQSIMPFDPFNHQSMMSPFGGFGMFGRMDSMMAQMNQMMEQARNNPNGNGQFYSQSSVMSFSNTGSGQPQVYQATSSVRTAPGGVHETRKAVRDSKTGIEKVEVGHRIGDRAHVISRSRNVRTGDAEENQEFENLDEEEAESFHNEVRNRTAPYSRRRPGREVEGTKKRQTRAIEYGN